MNKKIERAIQIIFIVMILIPAVSSARTYEHEDHRFSIDYPDDWEIGYPVGVTVAFAEPFNYANANVVVESMYGTDLDEYVELNRNVLSDMGIHPFDKGYITVNSLKPNFESSNLPENRWL